MLCPPFQLFLDPLGQAVGSTKSKQLLLQICSSVQEMNHLFKLGCLLGISEWANLIVPKCRLPEAAIQVLPSDMGELFDEDDEVCVNFYAPAMIMAGALSVTPVRT